MTVEQSTRRCCQRTAKYDVVYSGPKDQHLILCYYHFHKHPVFQKDIKTIKEI